MSVKSLPTADDLRRTWRESPRWHGIQRGYDAAEVVRLRGTIPVEHSIARITAESRYRMIAGMDPDTIDESIETTPGTAPAELNLLRGQLAAAKAKSMITASREIQAT